LYDSGIKQQSPPDCGPGAAGQTFPAFGQLLANSVWVESVLDRAHDRTQDDDHDCRQEAQRQRKEDLHRHLGRLLPGPLPALVTHLVGLRLEHSTDRQAERVGLREHDCERHQVIDIGPQLQVLECVTTREPEFHLAQCQAKLVTQRRLEASARDLHCLLESKARGDRDRHQVEHVGEVVGHGEP